MCSAVSVWRRRGNTTDAAVRAAVVALLELSQPPHAQLLVAIAPSLVGGDAGWMATPFAPRTQGHVFLQLSAKERAPLLALLRAVGQQLRALCDLDEELIGGTIGDGREPFGFRDSVKAPTVDERAQLAGEDGATHLMYLRFEQHLDRFAAQPVAAREGAMGQRLDGTPADAPGSHRARFSGTSNLVRRGFPYRQNGTEGLAFVAAASETAPLRQAWQHFAEDPLRRFVTPLSAGLYVAPPDPDWVLARKGAKPR